MSTNPKPTRRGFLGAAVALTVAPLVPASALAAAPAPHPRPLSPPWGEGADLLGSAASAALAAEVALTRLIEQHCSEWCELCCDAEGCRCGILPLADILEGEHVGPVRLLAPPKLSPHPAARVALFDLRDALLDLTAGHCGNRECDICIEADMALYPVRVGIDLLGSHDGDGDLAVEERELLSARRVVERRRRVKADGGAFLVFSRREHCSSAVRIALWRGAGMR